MKTIEIRQEKFLLIQGLKENRSTKNASEQEKQEEDAEHRKRNRKK